MTAAGAQTLMRSTILRIAVVCAGIAAVASCDTRTTGPIGGGGGNGGGGTIIPVGTDKPGIAIDTPAVNQLVNVGDSILVVVRLHDDHALASLTITGIEFFGSASLGTLSQNIRYTAPPASFGPDIHDAIVRRYLQPASKTDTTLDSLVIRAVATDSLGGIDSVSKTVDIVSGPHVFITTPVNGDSTPVGIGMTVTAHATHPNGLFSIAIHVQGDPSWPTPLDTTITQNYAGGPRDTTLTAVIPVPANAKIGTRISITGSALNVDGLPGTSGVTTVFVRATNTAAPLVTQVVSPRSELDDSVKVTAHGDGIAAVGYVALDSLGNVLVRDSVLLPPPLSGNVVRSLSLQKIASTAQGQRISIVGFAVDQGGRTGYAVSASQLTPVSSLAQAHADTTLLVYGHTYPIPAARSGIMGDVVWDAAHENVILSNMNFNRLEVFHEATKTFDPSGVAVGSLPWGMFISTLDPNVLLVANSGGTNLSKVDLSTLQELNAQRILTRGTYLFTVNEVRDEATGKLSETVSGPTIYSDRPQYVGQLASGTVFYSTRPTTDAPKGTIRYLDPTQAVPDPHPIIIYRSLTTSTTSHVVINADSVFAISGAAANASDDIEICDHPPGTALPSQCVTTNQGLDVAISQLQALVGSDVSYVTGVDITNSGLTDTTYVAVSGDRNWLAFGEGNTAGSGIIFMANSSGFFSPPITQVDLTNNASERVNGLALDTLGATVGAHGTNSFFAAVDNPFHLRLQGVYSNGAAGGGIAFHPQANAGNGDTQRTAFVVTDQQAIDIVDIFHYVSRGHLPIKTNLYGPIRAVLPGPSDAGSGIVLKLFGLSPQGLVVIDLHAGDILPSP
jgi:hypothetical protein